MFGQANLTFRNRREFAVLVSCARKFLDGAKDAGPLFAADIDWDAFLRLVERHRVVPQIHHVLAPAAGEGVAVAAGVRERIADLNADVVQHNLRLTAELVRIARVFAESGIGLLSFKGPTLAAQLYGGFHRRQFIDLDVLTRPEDLPAAIELFGELGYQSCGTELTRMSSRQLRRAMADSKSCELIRVQPKAALHVDLHWRLSNDDSFFSGTPASLFRGAAHVTISGQRVSTMGPRELVYYLAFHGGNHRWMRLSWLSDLAHAMRQMPRSEWPELLDGAAEANADRYLIGGLLLLERFELVEQLADTISPVLRGRLDRMVTEMQQVVSADHAAPLLSVLADGVWRYRFSGRFRPLANSLLRFVCPKQRDLMHKGRLRPYLSRWHYIAGKTLATLLSRSKHHV